MGPKEMTMKDRKNDDETFFLPKQMEEKEL